MNTMPSFLPDDSGPFEVPELAPEEQLPPPRPSAGTPPIEVPPTSLPTAPQGAPNPWQVPDAAAAAVPFTPVAPVVADQFGAVRAPAEVNQFGYPVPAPTPAFGRPPQHSSYDDAVSRGMSSEFNHRGHIAVAAGALASLLISLQWVFDRGYLWLTALIAIYGISQGIRGHNAANRGLATNPVVARVGLGLGLMALVACIGYVARFVVFVAQLTS